MSELIKKLNIKNEDDTLLIVNAIYGFEEEIEEEHNGKIHNEPELDSYNFIMIFGTLQFELEELAHRYIEFLDNNGVLWLAYPKKTSHEFGDCSKGTLWNSLKDDDFEAVRDISLNEEFNAIRFRCMKPSKLVEEFLTSEQTLEA